ncbi:hypothetical protein QAD02_017773 [Eretmocerus hayati]|uniref:Uncharacterized protein n=1 Tax=Eretmocerus hayati TaxID=131215 RepID=A0ACC2PET4_9HYME|nr:hypothetical protein QAD02_017773 [Eretmocerus hayati]
MVIVSRFEKNDKICPCLALSQYLEATQNLRKSVEELFISIREPHGAVTPQTLGRWIKATLSKCNIDVNVFSGYSTRHASTSLANVKGVSIDTIKNTAGWTKQSQTFAKFYNLPIMDDKRSFAHAILNS